MEQIRAKEKERKNQEKACEKFEVNIITNGILLTEELIDFMLQFENFKVLSVSIDNRNNSIRKIANLKEKNWDQKYLLVLTARLHALDGVALPRPDSAGYTKLPHKYIIVGGEGGVSEFNYICQHIFQANNT